MSDWQKGDLALCVKTTGDERVQPGNILAVDGIIWDCGVSTGELYLGLIFSGFKMKPGITGFAAFLFVKITPGAKIEGIEEPRRAPVPADQVPA